MAGLLGHAKKLSIRQVRGDCTPGCVRDKPGACSTLEHGIRAQSRNKPVRMTESLLLEFSANEPSCGAEAKDQPTQAFCACIHRLQFDVLLGAVQPATARAKDHAGNSRRS